MRDVKKSLLKMLRWILPYLVQYGISVLVSVFMVTWFYVKHLEEVMGIIQGQGDVNQVIEIIANEVYKYSTEYTTAVALLCIPILLFMFYRDCKKRKAMGKEVAYKAKIWQYAGIVIMGITACIAINNLLLMANIAFYSDTYQETITSLYQSSFLVQLVGLGVIVPISEELIFRGLIYNRLKEDFSVKVAAFISIVFFGIYHGNLVQTIYGIVLGAILVFVYEKYGSVMAPILCHMVLNLTSIIVTQIDGFTWMMQDIMRVGIVTVGCTFLASASLLMMQKMTDGKQSESGGDGTGQSAA